MAVWIAIIVMILGLAGTFLPIVPGTPLIFFAALGYAIYEKFQLLTPLTMVILFILMLLSLAVEYMAGMIGAKKYGASKWGIWGAFIGGILGVIFLNIIGLLLGPLVGAVAGELIAGKNLTESMRVGLGTILGIAGGAVVKFIIALSMFVVFITKVF